MEKSVADVRERASTEANTSTERGRGAESSGSLPDRGSWRVFAINEAGKIGHVIVVTAAPGVRGKRRLPKSPDTATPELRARFAKGAGPVIQREILAERKAKLEAEAKKPDPKKMTFEDVGKLWMSGDLAKRFPDHVKTKKESSLKADRSRLAELYKTIGPVPVDEFGIEDAERAMAALPERCREPATRRHYAQIIHRVLGLATYPLRLITHNPLPEGFLPKPGKPKADQWLHVDEEARLASCEAIPVARRILWGYLAREGMRGPSEAARMTWSNLDLDRGTVTLDENKTSVPRAWVLGPDVVRALRRWRDLRYPEPGQKPPPNELVFIDEDTGGSLEDERLADEFRKDLKTAKIDRAELYAKTKARNPIRAHDLRATFATIALANGRTETWVMDRGGWTTSQMVNRYRRTARTASEIGHGWFADLEHALFGKPKDTPDPDGDAGRVPAPGAAASTVRDVPSPSASAEESGTSQRDEDARDGSPSLGSTAEKRGGSSPPPCTDPGFSDGSSGSEDEPPGPVPADQDDRHTSRNRSSSAADLGTGGNKLAMVELRRTAAAALGMIDIGDLDAAREILRAFLRSTG